MIRISPARFQAFLLAIICCSGFSFLMPLRIYLICLFLGFTIFQNLEGSNMHLARQPLMYALLAFICVILAGAVNSYDRGETLKYAITFFAGACMVFLRNSDNFYSYSVEYTEIGCRCVAISICIQIVFPTIYRDHLNFLIRGGAGAVSRLNNELSQHIYSGIVGEKGEAAFLMVLAIVLLLSRCTYTKKIEKKDFKWLIIYLVALILPAKRMLFAVGILLIMLYIVFWTKGSKKVIALGSFGILGVLGFISMMVIPSLNTLLNRFTAFEGDDTANGRVYLWAHALRMFRERPFLGYGYGSYNKYASNQGVILTKSRVWESHAHSIYYQMLGEIGIIGLSVFIILNLTAIAMAIYLYKRRNRLSRRGCGYLFIGINIVVFVLVYGLTGNIIYYTNQIMVYLWGLGLLAYAYKRGFIAEVEK